MYLLLHSCRTRLRISRCAGDGCQQTVFTSIRRLTDMWYVIQEEGTLVTGGSLSQSTETETDEFRGPSITDGEERHIAPGDFVRIQAGVPHWIRKIDGNEILYLVVKALK